MERRFTSRAIILTALVQTEVYKLLSNLPVGALHTSNITPVPKALRKVYDLPPFELFSSAN